MCSYLLGTSTQRSFMMPQGERPGAADLGASLETVIYGWIVLSSEPVLLKTHWLHEAQLFRPKEMQRLTLSVCPITWKPAAMRPVHSIKPALYWSYLLIAAQGTSAQCAMKRGCA